jgi:hypothetical protein
LKDSPSKTRRAYRTTIEIDGETLYVRGGDMLRDEDQVIFEWARRNGLLSDEAIASVPKAGEH